jgi:hypothetical protein
MTAEIENEFGALRERGKDTKPWSGPLGRAG